MYKRQEANELNNILGQNKAVAIPIGVDINYYSYRICGSSVDIIGFLGAMDVSHNEACLLSTSPAFIYSRYTNSM